MTEKTTIFEAREVSVSFSQYEGSFGRAALPVIRDLSLRVRGGEMTAVVGASGSGKSLLAHAILGILPYNAVLGGEMYYCGDRLDQRRKEELRGRKIVLVPQSVSYLDPLMTVGKQVRNGKKNRESGERSKSLLNRYGLDERTESLYPFELSGGMTRRVLISTALMESPNLVIADEPTPGLHIEAARRVLGHFREIADDGAGVLLITHDLELALKVADRIAVFYAGTTVEEAPVGNFESESKLRHPYARALFRAMPEHGFAFVPGTQPYVKDMPAGCAYRPRCELATGECGGEIPLRKTGDGWVRCIHGE